MVDNIPPSTLPIVVINSDPSKNNAFVNNLKSHKVIQLDKVKGTDITIDDPKIVGSTAYSTIIKGALNIYEYSSLDQIGDTLTHLKAWYAILENGAPAAFVMSNEVNLDADFFQKVDAAYKAYPLMDAYSQWDLWLLNYSGITDAQPAPVFGKEMILVDGFRGTYGYIITRGAILKLMPHILPTHMQLDAFLSNAVAQYAINIVYIKGVNVLPPAGGKFSIPFVEGFQSSMQTPTGRNSMVFLGLLIFLFFAVRYTALKKRK